MYLEKLIEKGISLKFYKYQIFINRLMSNYYKKGLNIFDQPKTLPFNSARNFVLTNKNH